MQVGERRRAGLVRRIDHHQELAALGQVGRERLDLRRKEVGARAGDDHQRGAVGHGRRLRQHQLLAGVVVAGQRLRHGAVAGALAVGRILLAVAGGEVDLALLAGGRLDEGVGDVLLFEVGDALDAALVLQHHRAGGLDVGGLGPRRLAVEVDVVDRQLLALVGVLLEPVAEPIELRRLIEDRELGRGVEPLQHLEGLLRQAEHLVRRQVPALVLAHAQVVEPGQQREHGGDAHHRQRAELGLARVVALL